MEEISLELERVVPVGAKAKMHNELEGLGYEESGHIGFASSEELNSTKESLQSQIDTNANAIRTLSEGIDAEKIDSVKDLIDYVEEHQVDVISIQEGIEQNASDIDDLEGSVSSIGERVTALEEGGGGVSQEQVDEIENRVDNLELLHQDPLVATISITKASTTFSFNSLTGATMVDWGDGSEIEDISSVSTYKHTYAEIGTYEARFYGEITEIGNSAFKDKTTLLNIIIPHSVTYIGTWAFRGTKLSKVIIPSSVLEVDSYAFSNIVSLTYVRIEDGVTNVEDGCFSGCTALKNVVLSNTLSKINARVFLNCANLEAITLPKSISKIGYSAFNGCSMLRNITIPPTVTVIDETAFLGCQNLGFIELSRHSTQLMGAAFEAITKIIVPYKYLNNYKNSWSGYLSQLDAYAMASDIDNINTELTNILEGEGV